MVWYGMSPCTAPTHPVLLGEDDHLLVQHIEEHDHGILLRGFDRKSHPVRVEHAVLQGRATGDCSLVLSRSESRNDIMPFGSTPQLSELQFLHLQTCRSDLTQLLCLLRPPGQAKAGPSQSTAQDPLPLQPCILHPTSASPASQCIVHPNHKQSQASPCEASARTSRYGLKPMTAQPGTLPPTAKPVPPSHRAQPVPERVVTVTDP